MPEDSAPKKRGRPPKQPWGGARPGGGRRPLFNEKTVYVRLYLPASSLAQLKVDAAFENLSVSEYLRRKLGVHPPAMPA